MDSRHITGEAVDLVPYVNGKLRWEWPLIFPIAEAVRAAARRLGVEIRWGAAWDRRLTSVDEDPRTIMEGYIARRRADGHDAFTDGPHYELPR